MEEGIFLLSIVGFVAIFFGVVGLGWSFFFILSTITGGWVVIVLLLMVGAAIGGMIG
jgi:hypothetical protein